MPLIYGEIRELNVSSVGDIIHRGGTILLTARSTELWNRMDLIKLLKC